MDEKGITVPYLAKIAGVSEQMVWRDVRLLVAVLEDEPMEAKP